jgi:hypothetical protein
MDAARLSFIATGGVGITRRALYSPLTNKETLMQKILLPFDESHSSSSALA